MEEKVVGGHTLTTKGGDPPKRKRPRKVRETKREKQAAAGEQTPEGKTVEEARRNIAVYQSWAVGVDVNTLSQRHNLSPRSVRRIVDGMCSVAIQDWRDYEHPLAAVRDMDELIVKLDHAVSMTAQIVEKALEQDNLSAALGGLKRLAESRRELIVVKQARGLLPTNLHRVRNEMGGIELADRLMDILQRHGVATDEILDEIVGSVDMPTRSDRGRTELDMRLPELPPER
jgi:hypothetical protein